MKRVLSKIVSLVMLGCVLFLVGCYTENETSSLEKLANQLEILYTNDDTNQTITEDFKLPDKIEDASISWSVNDQPAIIITAYLAKVTRQEVNVSVVLTAKVSLNGAFRDKPFNLMVLAKEDDATAVYYTITWSVDENTTTTSVLENTLPAIEAPQKEGYTFKGWNPSVILATQDTTYVALFNQNVQPETPLSLIEQLKEFLGFDAADLLPVIDTDNYQVSSEETAGYILDVYVDIHDWTESDAQSFVDALDLMLSFDENEEAWIINDLYVYVFYDDQADVVYYGLNFYQYEESTPVEPAPGATLSTTITPKQQISSAIVDGSINAYLDFTGSTNQILTVIFAKNSSQVNTIFNNSSGEIRLYSGNTNGNALTINTASGYAITAITIATGKNVGLSVNNDSVETSNQITKVFASPLSSVTLQNKSSAGSGNVGIRSIIVTYQTSDGTVPENPSETLPTGTAGSLDKLNTLNDWQLSLSSGVSGMPSIGTFNVLVVPVEINGYSFDANYLQKLDLVFNGTSTATGWQSVSSYYASSSYGKLNITFDIVDKYQTSNNKSYYESYGDSGDSYAIKSALSGIDDRTDFSKYDYNSDGYIDGIIFVYSVDYDGSKDPWWAWVYIQDGWDSRVSKLDGKEFEYYMWISYDFLNDQTLSTTVTVNAETFIHEFGHMLGQTDLYSTTHHNSPLGDWDMMDYNSGDHGPFTKLLFGWLDPLLVESGYQYSLTIDSYATDDDGIASAILIPRYNANFADKDAFDEYLLIIFYTPEGLYEGHMGTEYGLSNAGIAIYHVDARLANNADYWDFFRNNNDNTTNHLVALLEADKNNSLPGNSSISQSDLLVNGTLDLSSYTWNQGGSIDIVITVESLISNTSENVTLGLVVN